MFGIGPSDNLPNIRGHIVKSWIVVVSIFLFLVALANIFDKGHDKGWIDTKLRRWLGKILERFDPNPQPTLKSTFSHLLTLVLVFVMSTFFSLVLYYTYMDEETVKGPWWLWPLYAFEAFPVFPFAPIGAIISGILSVLFVIMSAHYAFILVFTIMLKAATKPSTSPLTYLVAVGGLVGVVAKTVLDLVKS
jgi:hypothetical protein